jgi:hypothetical protein
MKRLIGAAIGAAIVVAVVAGIFVPRRRKSHRRRS